MNALEQLLTERIKNSGPVTYEVFTREALYHPVHGYYCQKRERVGKKSGTDFYTASQFAPVLATLITEAVRNLSSGIPLETLSLVEIGAEPDAGVMRHAAHHFADNHTIRVGEPLTIPCRAFVFSNELLDAQPFSRAIFTSEGWRELGVGLAEGALSETQIKAITPLCEKLNQICPNHQLGYIIDYPTGAEQLLCKIAQQPWKGTLLFLDYGHDLQDLLQNYPEGTARAYSQHRQHNDLLASPGEQDLTCHVHWDILEKILTEEGFTQVSTNRQEAFFMTHAASAFPSLFRSPQLASQLRELLHPAYFGAKFQALYATRI